MPVFGCRLLCRCEASGELFYFYIHASGEHAGESLFACVRFFRVYSNHAQSFGLLKCLRQAMFIIRRSTMYRALGKPCYHLRYLPR